MVRSNRNIPECRSGPALHRPAVLLCAILPFLVPALPSCSLPDDTAALVNDQPLSAGKLEKSYENFIDQFGEMAPPGEEEVLRIRKILLDRLIDQELMMQEIRKRGLLPSDEAVEREAEIIQGDLKDEEFRRVLAEAGLTADEWREKLLLDLAVQRLQEEVVYDTVTITEEEVRNYLEEHRTDFEEPEKVRASQILVRTREEAVEARKRIRKGEDFGEVAREISLSPDAENGGDLGFFARGQMPQEFEAVIFSLPMERLSSVVETTYGYHLFLLTERREARRRSEEDVHEEVRDLLFADKAEGVFRAWMKTLRQSAEIRYNQKIVPQ